MTPHSPLTAIVSDRQFLPLYLWSFASRMLLLTPFFALFLANRLGIGTAEITLLFATYSVARLVSEVPLGVLADRLGEVPTLRLSSLLMAFGVTLLVFGPLPALFVAQALIACAESASSGTQEALLYRLCSTTAYEAPVIYSDAQSVFNSAGWAGIVTAGAIGSLMSLWSLQILGLASLIISLGTLSLSFFLQRPKHATEQTSDNGWSFRTLTGDLLSDGALQFWFLLGATLSTLLTLAYFTIQPLLNELDLAGTGNGVLYSAVTVFASYGAFITNRLNSRLASRRITLVVSVSLMITAILGLRLSGSLIEVFFSMAALRFSWGWLDTNLTIALNEAMHTDEMRATLLSLQSLIVSLFTALVLALFSAFAVSALAALAVLIGLSAIALLCISVAMPLKGNHNEI